MCRLSDPVQGDSKAPFALRSHPSLAHDLVAWLEDLPKGAAPPAVPEQLLVPETMRWDGFRNSLMKWKPSQLVL